MKDKPVVEESIVAYIFNGFISAILEQQHAKVMECEEFNFFPPVIVTISLAQMKRIEFFSQLGNNSVISVKVQGLTSIKLYVEKEVFSND